MVVQVGESQEMPYCSFDQFNGFTASFPCLLLTLYSPNQPAVVLLAQKTLLSLKLALLQALHAPAPRLAGQGDLPCVYSHLSESADLGDPNST